MSHFCWHSEGMNILDYGETLRIIRAIVFLLDSFWAVDIVCNYVVFEADPLICKVVSVNLKRGQLLAQKMLMAQTGDKSSGKLRTFPFSSFQALCDNLNTQWIVGFFPVVLLGCVWFPPGLTEI